MLLKNRTVSLAERDRYSVLKISSCAYSKAHQIPQWSGTISGLQHAEQWCPCSGYSGWSPMESRRHWWAICRRKQVKKFLYNPSKNSCGTRPSYSKEESIQKVFAKNRSRPSGGLLRKTLRTQVEHFERNINSVIGRFWKSPWAQLVLTEAGWQSGKPLFIRIFIKI